MFRDICTSVQCKKFWLVQAFDRGPWPRMHGRERGQILYKLADLMEVRCFDDLQHPELSVERAASDSCCSVALTPSVKLGLRMRGLQKEARGGSTLQGSIVCAGEPGGAGHVGVSRQRQALVSIKGRRPPPGNGGWTMLCSVPREA